MGQPARAARSDALKYRWSLMEQPALILDRINPPHAQEHLPSDDLRERGARCQPLVLLVEGSAERHAVGRNALVGVLLRLSNAASVSLQVMMQSASRNKRREPSSHPKICPIPSPPRTGVLKSSANFLRQIQHAAMNRNHKRNSAAFGHQPGDAADAPQGVRVDDGGVSFLP
jgi:hypothetical protein